MQRARVGQQRRERLVFGDAASAEAAKASTRQPSPSTPGAAPRGATASCSTAGSPASSRPSAASRRLPIPVPRDRSRAADSDGARGPGDVRAFADPACRAGSDATPDLPPRQHSQHFDPGRRVRRARTSPNRRHRRRSGTSHLADQGRANGKVANRLPNTHRLLISDA